MEDLQFQPNVFTLVFGVAIGAVAIIGPIAFIVRWVLRPIDLAAKARQAPPRFSIGDFLCLFLAIQIPLSVIYRYVHNDDAMDYFWIFTIATWIVGPLIWITGARTLSKAGIHTWWHRFVFLGLVMPLVYYGWLPFTILSCRLASIIFFATTASIFTAWTVSVWIGLAGLFGLCAVFTSHMLRLRNREAAMFAVPADESSPGD